MTDASPPLKLDLRQAGDHLGLSPDTIRRYTRSGKLQSLKDNQGKIWVLLPADTPRYDPTVAAQPAQVPPPELPIPTYPAEPPVYAASDSALVAELRLTIARLDADREAERADRQAERARLEADRELDRAERHAERARLMTLVENLAQELATLQRPRSWWAALLGR